MRTMTTPEPLKIAVLTSGGDAQGMNAVVRAAVRTAIHEGVKPYAILEGWRGAVEGGDLIRELGWSDVSNTLSEGGTVIGTARCPEFRERSGLRAAVRNLVKIGIDRIVAIGGDGSLSGADELRELWPELLDELVERGEILPDEAAAHPKLHLAGVVGSIDNDLVGSDMTVGADSALHRIIEAIDAISSTAASHQRTFIIEVMGRRCGYLALMSAIAGGCDYVFTPEMPPADDWEDDICRKLREARSAGRRDSIIVVAEGAQDRSGEPITAAQVRDVLSEKLGEDVRITSLGHVQRGGTPSAYDRWMSTLLGYSAALEVIRAGAEAEPSIIVTQHNHITSVPLMEAIKNTRAVRDFMSDGEWDKAVASRGSSYRTMLDVFQTLSSPAAPSHDADSPLGRSPRVAVLHAGGLAPGMNAAARAVVLFGLDRGYTMLGVDGGFPGLLDGNIRELTWGDVDGWSGAGGAALGTRRKICDLDQFYALGRSIENNQIDAIVMIGGFSGYQALYEMEKERDRYPAFRIPLIAIPASIDNNLPGTDLSIGTDTALNTNAEALDRVKQSASASRRCFVAEAMGRRCGYLTLMSGITAGAERVYLSETGISLADLSADTSRMVESFARGRNLYLVLRNEEASNYYTSEMLTQMFEAEGHGLFDVRTVRLGHMQQGGNPAPFDRTLAVQLSRIAVNELDRQFGCGKYRGSYVGIHRGVESVQPIAHMDEQIDMVKRLPYDPWWLDLTDVLYTVADPRFTKEIGPIAGAR
ncbi:6-phosphofructokinase [Arcanobacterium haemolyticum]|nr:6-phosphofructokinase [Arcanobacterium haemolyticum]